MVIFHSYVSLPEGNMQVLSSCNYDGVPMVFFWGVCNLFFWLVVCRTACFCSFVIGFKSLWAAFSLHTSAPDLEIRTQILTFSFKNKESQVFDHNPSALDKSRWLNIYKARKCQELSLQEIHKRVALLRIASDMPRAFAHRVVLLGTCSAVWTFRILLAASTWIPA